MYYAHSGTKIMPKFHIVTEKSQKMYILSGWEDWAKHPLWPNALSMGAIFILVSCSSYFTKHHIFLNLSFLLNPMSDAFWIFKLSVIISEIFNFEFFEESKIVLVLSSGVKFGNYCSTVIFPSLCYRMWAQ